MRLDNKEWFDYILITCDTINPTNIKKIFNNGWYNRSNKQQISINFLAHMIKHGFLKWIKTPFVDAALTSNTALLEEKEG